MAYKFKIRPVFDAMIKNGKLGFADSERSRLYKYLISTNGPVEVRIGKKLRRRSNKQNRYFWGVVTTILYEETYGQFDDPDDVYHFLEDKFGPKKTVRLGDEERAITVKLKELDSNAFGETVLKIQQWAAETLGVVIPDPDKKWELNKYRNEAL